MPSVLTSAPRLNGATDHHSARCDARDGEISIEQVAPGAERLPGDDVKPQPPADGHVEVPRKGRAPSMGLHLDFMPGKRYAIETQAADAGHHGRPRPVLEDKAQAVLLRAQALEVGESLGEVARKLRPRSRRRKCRGHRE